MTRSAYSVVVEQSDIVVRFDRNIIDPETLVRFLDYLELETIRQRSQLTEDQAEELAVDVDCAARETLKLSFERR